MLCVKLERLLELSSDSCSMVSFKNTINHTCSYGICYTGEIVEAKLRFLLNGFN
jgi:hypothetical protein